MTTEEYQHVIDNEVKGAEAAVRKMLLYYISSLQTVGVEDIRQYVATKMAEMIQLTDEQLAFVQANIDNENKLTANLKNCIGLLNAIETSQKLDLDSIKIVKQVLELILKDYEDIIERH